MKNTDEYEKPTRPDDDKAEKQSTEDGEYSQLQTPINQSDGNQQQKQMYINLNQL